ncbi:hypothetical protein CSUNSWCD_1953 [Campylobacter showae CSUNSWCD]|uniref:Uncharacterized protein n=1 Tax=Campylobacter showae CSUNSWCD TaxID=1244083 RepID=M5IFV6_9BACT|nr:hypothetical protein CSUNSWCD_1953 [Campylobacter showae CSUNSWCD]
MDYFLSRLRRIYANIKFAALGFRRYFVCFCGFLKLKSNLTKASIKFGKFGNFYSEVKK